MRTKALQFTMMLAFCLHTIILFAQDSGSKGYWKSGGELIFSGGDIGDAALIGPGINLVEELDVDPIVRFSAFFHFQNQFHYDFSPGVGIFTGFGVRNIGWINEFNSPTLGKFKLKQRSYTFGVPLAVKLGDVSDGFYIAVGGEAELFFAYKQKLIYNDNKRKSSSWFADEVNLFNASVFLDIVGKQGGYIRFRYYLTEWLDDEEQSFKTDLGKYTWVPEQSQLFAVSIGTAINTKKYTNMPKDKMKMSSVY